MASSKDDATALSNETEAYFGRITGENNSRSNRKRARYTSKTIPNDVSSTTSLSPQSSRKRRRIKSLPHPDLTLLDRLAEHYANGGFGARNYSYYDDPKIFTDTERTLVSKSLGTGGNSGPKKTAASKRKMKEKDRIKKSKMDEDADDSFNVKKKMQTAKRKRAIDDSSDEESTVGEDDSDCDHRKLDSTPSESSYVSSEDDLPIGQQIQVFSSRVNRKRERAHSSSSNDEHQNKRRKHNAIADSKNVYRGKDDFPYSYIESGDAFGKVDFRECVNAPAIVSPDALDKMPDCSMPLEMFKPENAKRAFQKIFSSENVNAATNGYKQYVHEMEVMTREQCKILQKEMKSNARKEAERDAQMEICGMYLKTVDPNTVIDTNESEKCFYCKENPKDMEWEMLLCDFCDSGAAHCSCIDPPYSAVPEDQFGCPQCVKKIMAEHKEEYQILVHQKVGALERKWKLKKESLKKRRDHWRAKQKKRNKEELKKTQKLMNDCKRRDETTNSCGNDSQRKVDRVHDRNCNIYDEMEKLLQSKKQIERDLSSVKLRIKRTTTMSKLMEHTGTAEKLIGRMNEINSQLASINDEIELDLSQQKRSMNLSLIASCDSEKDTERKIEKLIENHQRELQRLQAELAKEREAQSAIVEKLNAKENEWRHVHNRQETFNAVDESLLMTDVIDEAMKKLEGEHIKWSSQDLVFWIKQIGIVDDKLTKSIIEANIGGKTLGHLNSSFLKVIGLDSAKTAKLIGHIERMRRKAEEQNSNRNTCTICCERSIDCVVIPCGHASFCSDCSDTKFMSHCPICRVAITKVSKIFMHGF